MAAASIEDPQVTTLPAVDSLTPAQLRIALALLRCVGRWGLAKTTIEDIAREAGISRATVYRLFPGGKHTILYAGVQAEVARLLAELVELASAADDLEELLVATMHHGAVFLDGQPALAFLREHERVELEQVLALDRMDRLFVAVGAALAPALGRFLPADEADAVGRWGARLVVSYLAEPSVDVDLCDRDHAERLVRTFVLPGLTPGPLSP
jgi:AcrR family transcriptional regulator